MEKAHGGEASTKLLLTEEDVSELRKYIVEMMHSELESMENIKQNEGNVTTVNSRISHFKELVVQERSHFKTLKAALEEDTKDLELLEEKRIVAEERHQRSHAAVAQQEIEVHQLCDQFKQQRAAMVSLRRQIEDANARLEAIALQNSAITCEMQNVIIGSSELAETTEQQADHQKIRVKIRDIQQYIVQIHGETSQIAEKRSKLEADIQKFEWGTLELRGALFCKEKESNLLFSRLREDTRRIIQENGKVEKKLKAKRKKFRLKAKNEMRSLKRRMSFITSELERGQMANEDALSLISALGTKREEFEQRLSAQNDQVIAAEEAVTKLSTSTSALTEGVGNFDTTHLQDELASRRKDAQIAQTTLQEKQARLKLLETDHSQLSTVLQDVNSQTLAAKQTAGELDSDLASLLSTIEEQESQGTTLRESLCAAKGRSKKLQANSRALQRKTKDLIKNQVKLRRQNDVLLEQENELCHELHKAERLSQILAEGIKYGTNCARQLDDSKAHSDKKQEQMELNLRNQEIKRQQQSACEKALFQAEVAAWDAKVKNVERQLQEL